MCEPMTAMVIITALAAGATAVGQKQQADTTQDIARFNADTEKTKADEALKQGLADEEQQLAKTRQIRASQEAVMTAGNVDPNMGTAGQVLEQTTRYGTLDALTIRANAQRQAWGFMGQATGDLMQGDMQQRAGSIGAFSTVLGGASRSYGIYRGVK